MFSQINTNQDCNHTLAPSQWTTSLPRSPGTTLPFTIFFFAFSEIYAHILSEAKLEMKMGAGDMNVHQGYT